MKSFGILITALLVAAGAVAAVAADAPAKDARFYYDLGPATVDVSAYPKKQQDQYAVFSKTCSQCHTLARPINAPYAKLEDWKRYVTRMHGKTKNAAGTAFSKKDSLAIIDFLAFDSKIRKLDKKTAFEAQTADLKKQFEQFKAERAKKQAQEDQAKVKQPPMPGQGVTPRP